MKKQPVRISLRTTAVVGITLLALILGGSTELWAQAVILLLAAVLILFFPPRVALGRAPTLVALLFLVLAFSAFLPMDWGIMPEWRRHLTEDLHANLGGLRTPQPWLTLQSCSLLLFAIVWTCYLFVQEWSPAEKSQALRLLVAGVILLAAVSIASYLTGCRIPGWNQVQNRGWFPNRNQTADVLALAGVVNYVIVFKRLQKREWTGILWATGLAVICTALVICYSRAGIVMFFAGIGLWHVGSLFRPGEGKSFAIGLASLLMLLSLFLLFGGTTLDRFVNVPESDHPAAEDYRLLLQEDALKVSLHAPFLGIGLGNFEPVFTLMREASAGQNRALHPESDWLWLTVEMGWIAPLLLLIGLQWWLSECLPFALKSGEALRSAAFVAFILFILHGFVDVSGHRLGSMLVGILLASLALSSASRRSMRPWIPPLFRGLALLLAVIGSWWLISFCAEQGPPTTATLTRLQTRINLDSSEGRLASVSEAANAALELAPLDWTFYFRRASAKTRTNATDQAANDFQIARYLEPHWIDLCVNEGEIWLAAGESDLCLNAWREALRRANNKGVLIYSTMLRLSQDDPVVHGGLKEISSTNADYLIAFLDYATPDEEKSAIDDLLSHDPTLSSLNLVQQRKLFAAWYTHGDPDELASQLATHTDWQVSGWKFLANHLATHQDFQMASMTSLRYLTPPTLPPLSSEQTLSVLESHFNSHPDDLALGVMLCQAQTQGNQLDEALDTLARLERLKDCPRFIYYLKAQIYVKKRMWEEAWNALLQFDAT